jgi:putative ABC transport system substrate-binding protein
LLAVAAFLALAVAGSAKPASAQPAPAAPRIGVLTLAVPSTAAVMDAFREALRELGYVDGRTVAFEYRYAEGRPERLPALAAELVRLHVDAIVTESNIAALAARQATHTIPVVMAIAGDPVKAGVVPSLARPGGNVTGLTLMHPELSHKRLQLLMETVPGIGVVAVVWNPADPVGPVFLRETEAAARTLHVKVLPIEARTPNQLDSALKAVGDAHPDAFFTLPGGLFQEDDSMRRIFAFATARRLPGVFANRGYAEAGALLSYGPDLADSARRAAVYVGRILHGARPGDLPIEQPSKFEMVINLRTAKAMGLAIPAAVRARADGVIE